MEKETADADPQSIVNSVPTEDVENSLESSTIPIIATDEEDGTPSAERIAPSITFDSSLVDDSPFTERQINLRRHTYAAGKLHPNAYLKVNRSKSISGRSPKRSMSANNALSSEQSDPWADYPCAVRFCGKLCLHSWLALVRLVVAIRAIIVRMGFICFACVAIVTVVREKNDGRFWLLCITIIPLLLELILAIKIQLEKSRNGTTISKWFSLCNFAFLICACPPIWIIELHHMDQLNNSTLVRQQLIMNSTPPLTTLPPWVSELEKQLPANESIMIMGQDIENYIHDFRLDYGESPQRPRRVRRHIVEDTQYARLLMLLEESVLQPRNLPLSQQIRTLEQLLLLSVIVGRWLMPREGISRDQLSQLLLINIGTAADILELFEAFNEEVVRTNQFLRAVILCLWQASLLQFCFNKTAVREPKEEPLIITVESFDSESSLNERIISSDKGMPSKADLGSELEPEPVSSTSRCCFKRSKKSCEQPSVDELEAQTTTTTGLNRFCKCSRMLRFFCKERPCLCCETELWAIGMSLMLQDLPFLCLRLTLIFYFSVSSYSNIFFTCKNTLLIMLQLFRSGVIVSEAYSASTKRTYQVPENYRKFSRFVNI